MLTASTRRCGSCGVICRPQIGGSIQSQLSEFTGEQRVCTYPTVKRFSERQMYANIGTEIQAMLRSDGLCVIIKLFHFTPNRFRFVTK